MNRRRIWQFKEIQTFEKVLKNPQTKIENIIQIFEYEKLEYMIIFHMLNIIQTFSIHFYCIKFALRTILLLQYLYDIRLKISHTKNFIYTIQFSNIQTKFFSFIFNLLYKTLVFQGLYFNLNIIYQIKTWLNLFELNTFLTVSRFFSKFIVYSLHKYKCIVYHKVYFLWYLFYSR